MATNFEFYKDEVLNWIEQAEGSEGCVAALYENLSGNFRGCETECRECGKVLVDFLNQEHIEQPKLTKRERAFCEAVQTGWIARDESDKLYWHCGCFGVTKMETVWVSEEYSRISSMGLDFDFIKWEDEKPWAVEDLLKLEVEE